MKRIVLFLVVLLMFASGCVKKKYPESVSENAPVFYFKANINNAAVEFNAGLNKYRMFSSYQKDSNQIYNLIAEMKQIDCSGNCPNSFKIQINDYTVSASGSAIRIDSSLKIGQYNYLKDINGSTYKVAFTSSNNKTAQSYNWDFGDGSKSTKENPVHIYSQVGKYQVCLTVTSNDGHVNTICNTINLNSNQPLNAFVSANSILGDSVTFGASVTGGKTPFSYSWDFGDGNFSQVAKPLHHYAISGSYPVKLKLRDSNNEELTIKYNVVTENDNSSMAVNYKSEIIQAQSNAVAPSKIILSYTDENGNVYSSINHNQPSTSSFEIIDVSSFDLNENNESTKKIKIKFNCMVYNGSKAISINNAETVIAVAYK